MVAEIDIWKITRIVNVVNTIYRLQQGNNHILVPSFMFINEKVSKNPKNSHNYCQLPKITPIGYMFWAKNRNL